MKIPVTDTTAEAVEVACDAAWEQGRADVLVELHETQAQRDQARDLAARLEEELAQVRRRQGIEWSCCSPEAGEPR